MKNNLSKYNRPLRYETYMKWDKIWQEVQEFAFKIHRYVLNTTTCTRFSVKKAKMIQVYETSIARNYFTYKTILLVIVYKTKWYVPQRYSLTVVWLSRLEHLNVAGSTPTSDINFCNFALYFHNISLWIYFKRQWPLSLSARATCRKLLPVFVNVSSASL